MKYFCIPIFATLLVQTVSAATPVLDIGSRLELFVDRELVERFDGTALKLHSPQSGGTAITLDNP